MLTLHVPTARSPREGALPPGPEDTAFASPTLGPCCALSWSGAVYEVLAWPSGALAPRPALSLASEQAVPFPGYRTRQLQDSSRVLSSPVVPGFPCCS